MKAVLEFDLPNDNQEFKHASKALDYYIALGDIENIIRNFLKYNNDKTLKDAIIVLDSIRSRISEATFDSE